MITIIDYDMGNLGSIKNMLHRIGCNDVLISNDSEDVKKADKIILPGVGAFDQGITNLKKYGLFEVIKDSVEKNGTPIMGICLGMQLLGRQSEEGKLKGLELMQFDSVRFHVSEGYKVPHMGWNYVEINKKDKVLDGMKADDIRFYFVHSFHAKCDNEVDILLKCEYDYKFAAAVSKANIYGFQFHPEKSHKYGMKLFENFLRI